MIRKNKMELGWCLSLVLIVCPGFLYPTFRDPHEYLTYSPNELLITGLTVISFIAFIGIQISLSISKMKSNTERVLREQRWEVGDVVSRRYTLPKG